MNTKNPYHKENVNQAQGPRTGNPGAHDSKRGAFLEQKALRKPLADAVNNAYAKREKEDYASKPFDKDGSIDPDLNVKF